MLELARAPDGGSGFQPPPGWSPPCPTDGPSPGRCRVDFSSMCYFFGRNIFATLKAKGMARPIGLIGTYWGRHP